MYKTGIEHVLFRRTCEGTVLLILMIVIVVLVCWMLSDLRHYKKLVALSIVLFIAITSYLVYDYTQIYLDLKYEDYITYQGEIIDRSGGMYKLSTVIIYDSSGKEIRLLNSGDVGEETYQWYGDTHYMGTVIYGRRSHVVVSCDAKFLSFQ